MKVFKKFLAALIAAVMAFALVAFAACDGKDGNNTGDTGNGGDTGNTETKTPAEQLLAAVNSATSYLEVSAEFKEDYHSESYTASDATAEKPADAQKYDYKVDSSILGKADVESGNADISYKVTETDGEGLIYIFARDWNMFSCYAEPDATTGKLEEITDFSGVTLEYGGDLNGMLGDILGGIIGGAGGDTNTPAPAAQAQDSLIDIASLATPAVGLVNTLAIRLAAAAETLEVKDGAYSVDVIKTLNRVWTKISTELNTVDANTTVGDLLANASVKKYVSVLTELVPAQTLYEIICGAVSGLDSQMQLALSFLTEIKPDKNSTTYDYIVKILSSDGIKLLLNEMFKAQGAQQDVLTTTLDKTKIGDLLAALQTDIDDFRNLLGNLPFKISGTKLTVTDESEYSKGVTDVTEFKLGYTVEDGKLKGQSVSLKYNSENKDVRSMGFDDGSGMQTNYYVTESTDAVEVSASLTYAASAATLTDISGCKAVRFEDWTGYKDGVSGCELGFNTAYFNDDETTYVGEYISVIVTTKVDEQGNVMGLYVNGDTANPVTDGGAYVISKEVEVYGSDNNPVKQDVDFTVVFTLEQNGYYISIEMTKENSNSLDYDYIYEERDTIYYNSTVSKILSGAPDWQQAAQ